MTRRVDVAQLALLAGKFTLQTYHPVEAAGPPLITSLHLEFDDARLVGFDEMVDESAATTRRSPVVSQGSVLLIGERTDGQPPSRYNITELRADGFAGQWETFQPESLRQHQPETPEWWGGRFVATREGRLVPSRA